MYLHCENIVVPTLLWSAGFECHVTMTVDVLYAMFICYQTSCLSSLPLSSRRFLSQDTRAYSANASGFKPIKPHCICTDALNQTEGSWTEEIILHAGSLKNYRNSSQCDFFLIALLPFSFFLWLCWCCKSHEKSATCTHEKWLLNSVDFL